jgi:hypothetical protein
MFPLVGVPLYASHAKITGFAPVDVVKSNSTCSRYVPAYANVIWLLLTIEIPLALFVVLKVTAFGVDATGLVWFPELVKFP